MEGPIRPKHHPRPLAVVSRMSADRLWLAHGRLWLTLPETLQVLTSARLSPAHARLRLLTSARLSRAQAPPPCMTLSDIVSPKPAS